MAVEVVVAGNRRSGGELITPRTIIPIKIIRSRVVIFSTELESSCRVLRHPLPGDFHLGDAWIVILLLATAKISFDERYKD